MPIPPELSDRIKDDKEIRDEFSKWQSIYFDPYKYYFKKIKLLKIYYLTLNQEEKQRKNMSKSI